LPDAIVIGQDIIAGAAMSFLKSLFGRRATSEEAKAPDPAHALEYKGFVIRAAPFKNEGQYQTAGSIEKEIDGVMKEHKFLRADRHAGFEDAVSFTLFKGRQIIDEQGERLFR
jgi:hypothetical protein